MELVSQLCFANGTPPDTEVVEHLLKYVTGVNDIAGSEDVQTKHLSAFKYEDSTPVVRSLFLQLLLQAK